VVELYYSVPELEVLLRFSSAYLRKRIHAEEFPGTVNIDGDLRVPASAVNAWLERHGLATPRGLKARTAGELRRKMGSPDV
jgi:predicted DNA-binding transcriptional regulator AlpA